MTKNLIPLIFFVFVNSKMVHSQSLIGITGGYTKSFFRIGRDLIHNYIGKLSSPQNDCTFGIFYKERKAQPVNLIMDFNYLRRRAYIEAGSSGNGGSHISATDLDFHSFSFKIAPEFNLGKKIRTYLNFGPSIGYIFMTKAVGSGYTTSYSGTYPYITSSQWDISGKSKSYVYGWELGVSSSVGIEIPLSKKIKLNSSLNYNLGLTSISKSGFSYSSIKSNTIFVSVGVAFALENFDITSKINHFLVEHPNLEKADNQ